jgi:tRNA threonylcarbamoyladenosine biosynthesis protein TsaE
MMLSHDSIIGEHRLADIDDTQALAARVANNAEAGDILLLHGDIGVGKTTFTQYLATTLQVADKVTSPTFTIAAEYDIPSSHIFNQLVHIDLYRLEGDLSQEDKAHLRDMFDMARQLKRLIVVEWAERLGDAVPEGAFVLRFSHGQKEQERIVKIEKSTTSAALP